MSKAIVTNLSKFPLHLGDDLGGKVLTKEKPSIELDVDLVKNHEGLSKLSKRTPPVVSIQYPEVGSATPLTEEEIAKDEENLKNATEVTTPVVNVEPPVPVPTPEPAPTLETSPDATPEPAQGETSEPEAGNTQPSESAQESDAKEDMPGAITDSPAEEKAEDSEQLQTVHGAPHKGPKPTKKNK